MDNISIGLLTCLTFFFRFLVKLKLVKFHNGWSYTVLYQWTKNWCEREKNKNDILIWMSIVYSLLYKHYARAEIVCVNISFDIVAVYTIDI